jgi:DNA-binding NarL/FixJ family response regulator
MDKSANCRALTVLCAAPSRARLDQLRKAAVAAEWELVGGASSLAELAAQLRELRPNVVVLDASLGPQAATRARKAAPRARIVSVGELPGVDAVASTLGSIREAIVGAGRPVRSPRRRSGS